MRAINFILIIFLSISVNSEPSQRSFEGYHLVRLVAETQQQVELIHQLEATDLKFDVWKSRPTKPATFDVLLSPKSFIKYKVLFVAKNITMKVLNNNIQRQINDEKRSMLTSRTNKRSVLFQYLTYQEVNSLLIHSL